MKAWDFITPHRMIINSFLRKSSQQLREEIDQYQDEYERRIRTIEKELEDVEVEINRHIDAARDSLNQQLKEEHEVMLVFQDNVLTYISKYQYHLLNKQITKIYKTKKDILWENVSFLSQQINLNNEEIELLRERINQLTAFTSTKDIRLLASQSGYDLGCSDDARTLMQTINNKINETDDKYEKHALLRLKNIVQERSEYIPAIDYLSWVINVKKQINKNLASLRRQKKAEIKLIDEELTKCYEEYNSFNKDMEKLSEEIRHYWAEGIAYANVEICYLEKQKQELIEEKQSLIDEHKEVREELRHLADMHSDDQYRWDQLQSEKDDLSMQIDDIKDSIDHMYKAIKEQKVEADYWYGLRRFVCKLCKENKAPLKSDRNNEISDEEKILQLRLDEISDIRDKGMAEAVSVCEGKKKALAEEYTKNVEAIESDLSVLTQKLKKATEEHKRLTEKRESSLKILEQLKKRDTRGFISKLLSDSPDVVRARTVVQRDNIALVAISKEIKELEQLIKLKKQMIEDEKTSYAKTLAKCKPIPLHPTKSERSEERKIEYYLNEMHKTKEGGNED